MTIAAYRAVKISTLIIEDKETSVLLKTLNVAYIPYAAQLVNISR